MPRKQNNKGKEIKSSFRSSDDYEMAAPAQSSSQNNQELAVSNRFDPISDFPQITYAAIAQNPQNPSLPKQPQSLQKAIPKNTKSQYIAKPVFDDIAISPYFNSQSLQTIQKYTTQSFYPGCNWLSSDSRKTQTFYEFILVDTGSASFKHEPCEQGEVAYSKCIIKKVISIAEWGDISTIKTFSKRFFPQNYTFHDYKMAWYRAFYFRSFTHSWFINFDKNCINSFPIWFFHWWLLLGADEQIYPAECKEGFQAYSKHIALEKFKIPLCFHAEFKIPWILCWSFTLQSILPKPFPWSLVREFKVKWWDKFQQEICSAKNVQTFFLTGKKLEFQPDAPLKVSTPNTRASPSKTSPSPQTPQTTSNSKPPKKNSLSSIQKEAFAKLCEDPDFARRIVSDYLSRSSETEDNEDDLDDLEQADQHSSHPIKDDPFNF